MAYEYGIFAEYRSHYRISDEAYVSEGQHESVDALHVLVFRDDSGEKHGDSHEKCVCHAAYGQHRQDQTLVRRNVSHDGGYYQAGAADIDYEH